MSGDPEHITPLPKETPKPGEHLITQGNLERIPPAERTNQERYGQISTPIGPDGRYEPTTFDVTVTPAAQHPWAKVTPGKFRRMRAESGPGPGGSKSPRYWEPSSDPLRSASLNIDTGAEIEVVAIQNDKLGNKEMIVRYVGGPANFFPGGDSSRRDIEIDEIETIGGKPKSDFFRDQVFIVPLNDQLVSKLRKKPEPRPSIGKRFARLIHRGK